MIAIEKKELLYHTNVGNLSSFLYIPGSHLSYMKRFFIFLFSHSSNTSTALKKRRGKSQQKQGLHSLLQNERTFLSYSAIPISGLFFSVDGRDEKSKARCYNTANVGEGNPFSYVKCFPRYERKRMVKKSPCRSTWYRTGKSVFVPVLMSEQRRKST